MALTNFASDQIQEKIAWAMETWRFARERSFIMMRLGTGSDAAIQRITELSSTPAGNKALITLLHDLVEDGVVGDQTLEGREERAKLSQIEIVVDQMRHGVSNTGRMSDQKGVLKVRQEARDLIGYAMADRIDQLAFLTLAGVGYNFKTDGSARGANDWTNLEFATHVSAPTANRHYRWDKAGKVLAAGNTAAVLATDTLDYNALIELKAQAHDSFIRPIRVDGGVEYFEVYLHPQAMKSLLLDPEFQNDLRNAMPRSPDNPLFKGAEVYFVNGLAIHPYRHSFNTRNAATKWGAANDVVGNRVSLIGAQGLAFAELGSPIWEEEEKDYKSRWGIGMAQILGFRKPQFPDQRIPGSPIEDFGVVSLDVAI